MQVHEPKISPSFKGKVVLVTGATSGIGRATAKAFGKAGAVVVCTGRDAVRGSEVVEEIRIGDGTGEFVKADLSDRAEIDALFAKVAERHGRLDCAVNNAAGRTGVLKNTANFTDEDFDQTIAVDLRAVWLCMKHEIRMMLEQAPKGGTIVNTSSVNGLGGARGGSLYSAAKAGVIALAKCAAQEYAADNIRVNVFVPGAFDTPMLASVFEQIGGGTREGIDATRRAYAGLVPLARIGAPEEAANAILWLSSESSNYVTGSTIIVDGGMSAPYR